MEFKFILVLTLFIISYSPSPTNSKSLISTGIEDEDQPGLMSFDEDGIEDDYIDDSVIGTKRRRIERSPQFSELKNEDGDTVEEDDAERDLEEYETDDNKNSSSTTKKPSSTTSTSTSTTTTAKTTTTTLATPSSSATEKVSSEGNSTRPAAARGPPPGFPPGPPSGLPGMPPQNGTGPPKRPGPPKGLPGFPPGLPGLPPGIPGFGPPRGPSKPTPPPPEAKQGELYLPEDYNKLEIPKLNLGKLVGLVGHYSPVPVNVYLNIRSVRDWNEKDEEIVLEMDVVIEWVDGVLFDKVVPMGGFGMMPPKAGKKKAPPRLKTLSPIFLNKIWTPDIYIDSLVAVESPKLITKPRRLKFSPDSGLISYYSRVAATIKCDMDFYYYPADTQKCPVILKSYSYFNSDLELNWQRHGVFLQEITDPNFDLAVGDIEKFKLLQDFDNFKNESHDVLRFNIFARRKLSYHIVQTYIPSVFFVVITWLCFMIPPRMVEARIAMAMTTLLTMTAMFSQVRDQSPVVSYVKAIDMWMVACIFFIFLTLLEFAVLVWFRSAREDEEEAEAVQEKEAESGLTDLEIKALKAAKKKQKRRATPISELIGAFIEKYAFIIYSIVFIIFAVCYWLWLLSAAEYSSGWVVNATHNNVDED